MKGKKEIINQLFERQKQIKIEQLAIKKRAPRAILGFLVFIVILYNLIEGKFNTIFRNSTNLLLICLALLGLITLFYMVKNLTHLMKLKKEKKKISSKIFSLTKLK